MHALSDAVLMDQKPTAGIGVICAVLLKQTFATDVFGTVVLAHEAKVWTATQLATVHVAVEQLNC